MRKSILLILLIISVNCFAQENTTPPNYSFFKLLIANDKQELLLVKWHDSWEVPGIKYNSERSIKGFIDQMGKQIGIEKYDSLRLSGLFTFHAENKDKPTLTNYYSLRFISGSLVSPPGCTDIKWFSYEEAMKLIPYEDMKEIVRNIFSDRLSVFGGAISKRTDETGKTIIQFPEPIYKLADANANNK